MHTLNRIITKALWFFFPPALAILFAIAANSAFKYDGIYVGHPIQRVVYVNAKEDPRISQLADAIDRRQLRSR